MKEPVRYRAIQDGTRNGTSRNMEARVCSKSNSKVAHSPVHPNAHEPGRIIWKGRNAQGRVVGGQSAVRLDGRVGWPGFRVSSS